MLERCEWVGWQGDVEVSVRAGVGAEKEGGGEWWRSMSRLQVGERIRRYRR